MTAVGFLPLFGGPGYEQSLASGLLVPSAAAIASALDVTLLRPSPAVALSRGVASGLLLAAVSFFTALLHGVRTPICDLTGGATGFILTAGVGSVLGGTWGATAGLLLRSKRRVLGSVLVGLAAPVGSIVVSLWRFYTSPMIFAFDPFVGYFSGTLYDTIVEPGEALYTYRAGSLATLIGCALVASCIELGDRVRVRWCGRLALGAAALVASVLVTVNGDRLGHWSTSASIARDLGGRITGDRCEVVYPSAMRTDEAKLMLKDCEEQLADVEREIGARLEAPVRAFFFRDAAEKKRLMGAADTLIAKPWRREVYLQVASYPHPVLGHELAHVVAGLLAPGPFHVAGGLWPNPGLIEGIAVAAAPHDDDLTDAQWARAMMDLGVLPPIETLFSFGFLGQNASKSYTVAGAFVRWIMRTYGAETVRRWYGGEKLEALTSQPWKNLDRQFRGALAELTTGPEGTSYAKAKFDRPSIFQRRCPHVIDALRRRADHCRDAQRTDEAMGLYADVLARDAHDWAALYGRAQTMLRQVDASRGQSALEELLSDATVPRTWRDRAEEALADWNMLDGAFERAAHRYRLMADKTLDEDAARTLEVKALAAETPELREPIVAWLLGDKDHGPDQVLGAALLGRAETQAGLPRYLLGKNLAQRGLYARAAEALDRAMEARLPTERLEREAVRQRGIAACALGQRAAVSRMFAIVEDARGPFAHAHAGRRDALVRLLKRCRTEGP